MNTIKHIAFENVYVYNFMPTVLPKRRLMRPLALIQRLPLEDGCSGAAPRRWMFCDKFQVKGQGQTADHHPKCSLLNILCPVA